MAIKKATKSPAVVVETRKMSSKDTCGCGMSSCHQLKHLLMFVLVIINTLMILWILVNQTKIEADKVGGRANYQMVQQIYKSDLFKSQQAQQIQQAVQMYQGQANQQAVPAADTTTQIVPAAE